MAQVAPVVGEEFTLMLPLIDSMSTRFIWDCSIHISVNAVPQLRCSYGLTGDI
jgi:hypothetical protein